MVFLLPKIRQDVANSSFLGSYPESGGANPPLATSLIVRGRYGHFFCYEVKICLIIIVASGKAFILYFFLISFLQRRDSMFVLENIQKVEIIGENSIDWLNISCTFFSVLLGAFLAYYFSMKINRNNNKRDYKNNLLHETLKHINLLQDGIIKRNEIIIKMLSIKKKDKLSFNDYAVSILIINENIIMYQNDIKLKFEILKNEAINISALEKLVNNSIAYSKEINNHIYEMMFFLTNDDINELFAKFYSMTRKNKIEEKYKITDIIYECKRDIEYKLKDSRYN